MQDLKSTLQAGDLPAALELAKNGVRTAPNDDKARIALFEVLCLAGDLDRAEKHLEVIAAKSMENAYSTTGLKVVLDAERQRRLVLGGKGQPDFFAANHDWAQPLLLALAGNPADGAALEEARPTPHGTLNGTAFQDLRDGDDLLAPLLEIHVAGRYVWLAWTQIRSVTTEAPRTLRDTCWLPAKVLLRAGNEFEGHIPVLYAGSHECTDDKLKLGHATDWEEVGGLVRGKGRRSLYANGEEYDLLAIRELVFEG